MDKAIPVPGRSHRQVRVAWSYLNKTSCVERETLHNYCNLELFWVQPITFFFYLFMMIFTETVFYSILSFIFSYQKIEMGFRAKLLQHLVPHTHHLIVILSTSLLSGQHLRKTNIFQDSAHRQGQWGLLWPMHPSTLVMPRPAVLANPSNTASHADWRTPLAQPWQSSPTSTPWHGCSSGILAPTKAWLILSFCKTNSNSWTFSGMNWNSR